MFKKFIDALKPPQEPDVKEPEKETAVPQMTYTKPISYETTIPLQELDRIQKAKMNALWAQMAEVIQPAIRPSGRAGEKGRLMPSSEVIRWTMEGSKISKHSTVDRLIQPECKPNALIPVTFLPLNP